MVQVPNELAWQLVSPFRQTTRAGELAELSLCTHHILPTCVGFISNVGLRYLQQIMAFAPIHADGLGKALSFAGGHIVVAGCKL